MKGEVTYSSVVENLQRYVAKKSKYYLIICKNSKKQKLIDEHRILLFYMVGKIVIKQISYFQSLINKYNKKSFHTKDDLVVECFLVFDRCVKNFIYENYEKTNFYLFYNKALSREMFRLFEKNYLKHDSVDNNLDDYINYHPISQSCNEDFVDFYLDNAKLTTFERKIVLSRLKMEKKDDFIKRYKKKKSSDYYNAIQEIKRKFKFLNH